MLNCLCGRELDNLMATIGVGFLTQEFDIETAAENWQTTLYLWDTSGTERYRSIITPYLRHVGIVFIVFDVGDSTTWNHVDYWRDLALEHAKTTFTSSVAVDSSVKEEILPLICLVGCQADKPLDSHAVTENEISEKAAQWNCPWWKVSTRSPLKLEGTSPHCLVSMPTAIGAGGDGGKMMRLAENPQAKSVWSHFLKSSPRLMNPREQMFTVFSHMVVEFHHFARRVGYAKLNYETCSLGPEPLPVLPSGRRDVENVIRLDHSHKRQKSGCCLDK